MKITDPKAKILHAASLELLEGGPRGFSMERLARRLRTSKRTLYACFESRDALLAAVVDRFFDRLGRSVAGLAEDSERPLLERLVEIVARTAHSLSAIQPGFLDRLARDEPRLAERVRVRRRLHMRRYLIPLLEQAQAEGLARADVPPSLFVEMAVACVDRLSEPERIGELPVAVRELPAIVVRTLFWGVLEPGVREPVLGGQGAVAEPDASPAPPQG